MSTRGYGSYRGRSTWKRVVKFILIFVLVLALLCAVAGAYLQQFLIISDDGVRLELPFAKQEEPSPTPALPAPSSNIPVVVTPEPTPTPAPTPTPEPDALLPVLLPTEALYDGSALDQVNAAGGDCALFDMKADTGMLNYVSTLDKAVNGALNPEDADRNRAIQALNETEELYTVARVSCFKDHGLVLSDSSTAIFTNSGYRWTDPEGVRWTSPTNPAVRDYVAAVCVELAQLGFDEILLDNAGYPNEGNLHYIKRGEAYDASRFSAVIDGFYAQIAAALADYDVKLSVVTSQEALAGTDTLTGQTPENLGRMNRLWLCDEAGTPLPQAKSSAPS